MNLQISIPLIAVFSMLAAFMIVISVCVIRDKRQKQSLGIDNASNEWLFSNWTVKTYDSFFKKQPEEIAKKINIKYEEYENSCRILNKEKDLKSFIIKKILGLIISFVFLIVLVISKNYFCAIGVILGLLIFMSTGNKEKKDAMNLKTSVVADLPRFLNLLQTALYINMPIEEAIRTTATQMTDSALAKEFISTMSDVRIGAHSWDKSLQTMAGRFQIDDFSDFVMDLTISYEKGLNIYQLVVDRSNMIKNSNLLNAKEQSSKLHSKIIMPIVVFKLVPMLAMLMIPIMQQALEGMNY